MSSYLLQRLRFFCRKFALGFQNTDLVLDVGSGNDPHPRADVLCDKFVSDDTERQGSLTVDRPLVGGDLEHLPFRDRAFGFAIASHVLEHVSDPERAAGELSRVARRGYVETPAEFGGKLMDLPGHRWYVREEGSQLVFTGKSQAMYDDVINHVAFTLWGQRDDAWMRFFYAHRELFFVEHRWDESLAVRVLGEASLVTAEASFIGADVERTLSKAVDRSPRARLKHAIRDYYRSPLYGPRRPVELSQLCVCPICRGTLRWEPQAIHCTACQASFPQAEADGCAVPMLLRDLAR
ncbi:MAG: methyltransferase domain-containing protein [Candidatus Sericytochromatia bacterium]|nr:methyltransferase domain-containing protein [Candidatus Sericytochromatia bacterium]